MNMHLHSSEGLDQQEIEWQFDAIDVRPVERWLAERDGASAPSVSLSAGSVREIVDRYFDTDDWRIYRAGYALRLRTTGEHVEATLKRLEGGSKAYRVRQEITQPLGEAAIELLASESGPVSERVRALIGPRRLRLLFTYETRRQAFPLTWEGDPAGEVTLDNTAIVMGPGVEPVRLRRVEVEVPGAAVERVEPFVSELRDSIGLAQSSLSKFGAGLIAHGYQPPQTIDLGPTAIKPTMTIGEVAYAVLRKHFGLFLAREPGTRLGDDIEELHDMRVAARRLRAALSLFRDVLPPQAEHPREELRWVAGALGNVRDIDVQREQLAGWIDDADPEDREALGALADLLDRRRSLARAAMFEVLDSARYDAFVVAFQALLRRGPEREGELGSEPALALAPGLIERRYKKVRKLGDRIGVDAPPEQYHELRIQGKRLRYALEFLSPLYGKAAQGLIASLVALQDLLGGHQDAYVAIHFLRELAAGTNTGTGTGTEAAMRTESPLPGPAIFATGRIAQRYAAAAAEARQKFPKLYDALKGKSWKQFQKTMERG